MKVKIEDPETRWERVKEILVLILWSAIVAVAAFGWGMIYESRRHDNIKFEDLKVIQKKIEDLNGRMTILEIPIRNPGSQERRKK